VARAADRDWTADVTGESDRSYHVGDARIAAIASATPRHRAVIAGNRSMDPFQTRRRSSYVGSPG
jgi:hypothetical protein